MNKTLFLFLLAILFACRAWSQDSKVVELDVVEIIPTDQILVYSNFSKRHQDLRAKFSGVGVSKIATVTGFVNPKESAIELDGLELFFNYDWVQDSSGFYVLPVMVREEDGLPVGKYTDFPEKYLVKSKLENRLFIDLSSKKISLEPKERIFIGIKFLENVNPETQNTFNSTFISGKIEEYTYLLYPDGRKPEEVLRPGKNSAGLKYSVVYKMKE
ncbi:hypothetical protein [Algoriphagus boritolerans]|uniref:Uncharacterized protein n=1 Tax=Algoriphagus boritolerans DSM 17298 = JCM 18970 TaxID=1120964 RepID=A0A1H5X692_9BACT|nr:hypothetical protein [Algoriphagus boritolerans]SEG06806.1 hypothetical protein SAMN03080598_02356 [Algoriphagus boritolerans DSM 17298 = JCM 18970]